MTVAGLTVHPPWWSIAAPSAMILASLYVSSKAFEGDGTWLGPEAASLATNASEPVADLRLALIGVYVSVVTDNRAKLERRWKYVRYAIWMQLLTVVVLLASALAIYLQ